MKKEIIVAVLFFTTNLLLGQVKNKREVGARAIYGIYNQVLPEGDIYRPIVLLPYYNYYISKRENRNKFSIYAEPQFTFVMAKYLHDEKSKFEHEIGVNFGFTYSYWFNWFSLYTGIGSGPNFISISTKKQAKGFIFSDNFYVGLKRELKNNYYIDFHLRVRHISNAGLNNPNWGINNIFAGIGVSKFISQ